jgi:hypothetical protein
MKFTRRSFIGQLSLSVLAAASVGSLGGVRGQSALSDDLFLPPAESLSDPLNYLTSKHFEPFISTLFKVNSGSGRDSGLTLVEVRELGRKANGNRGFSGESYSLLFQGPTGRKLGQGRYRVHHDALGDLDLFVVPVGRAAGQYEAIVNRISR